MKKHHILIVEDEKSIRDMVYFALDREGYEIDEAVDGKQATEKLTQIKPSLILMDWMLPDTSGIELVRRIKRDGFQCLCSFHSILDRCGRLVPEIATE